jgi:hypothetical protein
MSRLGHSIGGMRRLFQLSGVRVTICVEGRDLDENFYSRICGPICSEQGLQYEIVVADRIGGSGGGKGKLTRLFEHLRRNGALLDHSGTVSKLVMFYLDKDTDDIFRTRRRSDHIVYTSNYCAENHLYCDGDLIGGIAAAGSIDPQIVQNRILDCTRWRRNSVVQWRAWIELCLIAQKLRIGARASYSVNHATVTSNVNVTNLATCLTDLQVRSGLATHQFNTLRTWAANLVNRSFRNGQHDRIFKGKWYSVFTTHEVQEIGRLHPPINLNGATERLVGYLSATLKLDAPWTEHYKTPLRRRIAAM